MTTIHYLGKGEVVILHIQSSFPQLRSSSLLATYNFDLADLHDQLTDEVKLRLRSSKPAVWRRRRIYRERS